MPTIEDQAWGTADTSSSTGVLQARRVVDIREKIYLLEPSATPLTLLTSKSSKSSCFNPKFDWIEDEAMPIVDTANGTFVTTTTEIAVDNVSYWSPNTLFKVSSTDEVCKVTSIAGSSLTIVKSWGGTPDSTIPDGAELLILGSAAAENASAEAPRQVQKTSGFNYTQIFRNGFGVSGTLDASKLYGGSEIAYLHKARAIDHAKQIELTGFFGERAEVTDPGPYPQRSTGGLKEFITTNSTDFTGAITLAEVEAAANVDFRYGRKKKILFCARAVLSNLSALAHSSLRVVPSDKTFGIGLTEMVTSHGTYMLVPHDLFVTADYDEIAFVVDMDNWGMRNLQGRDTKLKTNIQAPDVDGREDEYLSEVGWERKLEKTHGIWLGAGS
jgi:hypothetical protein